MKTIIALLLTVVSVFAQASPVQQALLLSQGSSGCSSTATATTGGIYSSSPSDNFATGWTGTNSTFTASAVVAPDCTTTAATFKEDSANATHEVRKTITTTLTGGQVLSFEVYLKRTSGTRNVQWYVFNSSTASFWLSAVDLSNCTALAAVSVGGTWSSPTGAISSISPSWCKVSGTVTVTADTGIVPIFYPRSGASISYTGDNTSTLGVWGFHVQ